MKQSNMPSDYGAFGPLSIAVLWWCLLMSTFSSFGWAKLGPVPATFFFQLALGMYFVSRVGVRKATLVVSYPFIAGFIYASLASVMLGTFVITTSLNHLASIVVSVLFCSFLLGSVPRSATALGITYLLRFFALAAAIELIFPDVSVVIREVLYQKDVRNGHYLRDLTIYGLVRPTAFFNEPSTLGKSVSFLLLIRYCCDKDLKVLFRDVLIALVIIRSPMVTMAGVLVYLNLLLSPGSIRVGNAFTSLVGFIALVALIFLTQGDRVGSLASVLADGSLLARVTIPAMYVFSDPVITIFGAGPSVTHEVNEFARPLMFDTGRDWIYDADAGRLGAAPLFLFPAFYGFFGLTIFIMTTIACFQRCSLKILIFIPITAFFLTGFNSVAAVFPLMAVALLTWRDNLQPDNRDRL